MQNLSKLFQNQKAHLLLIVVLTSVVFSNTVFNGFVIDDNTFIIDWQAKKDLTNLQKVLTGDGPASHLAVYRPLRNMLYVLYHPIFGENPLGYHLHALIVHLLVTGAVYFIFISLLLKKIWAFNVKKSHWQHL